MANLRNLIERWKKIERQKSFLSLLDSIGTGSLSPAEQSQLLARIAELVLKRSITPSEANTLTKTISS